MIVARFAEFILFNKNGKILLQHRDMNPKRDPGCWGLFGGGIEEGEVPEEAVKREAMEELNIDLVDIVFFKKFTMNSPLYEGLEERYIFIGQTSYSVQELRKGLNEGDDLGFFSEDEIPHLKLGVNDMPILKEVFNKIDSEINNS